MNIILSHYGWMVTRHLVNTGQLRLGDSPANDLLLDLWTGSCAPYVDSTLHNSMLAEGLGELVNESVNREEIQLRYRRNPFEYVEKVIFEFTTYCNFNCDHCYNAQVPRFTEADPRVLAEAADDFIRMGIRRFDFIGGEVSRYGVGWLDVAEHIRSRGSDIITIYTNGWWLEQENFQAAGQSYVSTQNYLDELKRRGVSHVVFSLDGPDELHDASRHHSGLYQKILHGLGRVKQAGLIPRVSLLIRPEWSSEQVEAFLAEAATLIYDLDPNTPARKRALRLSLDTTNTLSNFIDIGNGAGDEHIQFPVLDGRSHPPLYCRNFYRLSPSLTIKANGELATCRLSQTGEGYGNLHERSLLDILNHFDETFVYQLHADRQLENYLPLIDRSIFGISFTHLCSLRSIVTMLARKMHEQNVALDDISAIQSINREVAVLTGHLPRHNLNAGDAIG